MQLCCIALLALFVPASVGARTLAAAPPLKALAHGTPKSGSVRIIVDIGNLPNEQDDPSVDEPLHLMNLSNSSVTTARKGDAFSELPEYPGGSDRNLHYEVIVKGTLSQSIVAVQIDDNRAPIH